MQQRHSYVELEYNPRGQIQKEDHSGAVTLWEHDTRGFPVRRIQKTGTADPDVVTEYAYNNQGQCVKTITADAIQYNSYDIMGNKIHTRLTSPSDQLIFSMHAEYNLNNQLILTREADPQNNQYFEYTADGRLKISKNP